MQTELSRRLKAVVDERYGGVARKACLASGVHENQVMRILVDRNHLPNLRTLDKLATAFGWDLGAVAYWALDRPVPPLEEGPGDQVIARILARDGYSETDREFIRLVLERAERAPVPRTESP